MKALKLYINKALHVNRNTKIDKYNYHPKSWKKLCKLVEKLVKERGNDADLNDIDTSAITNMEYVFYDSEFNGDISNWNVSKVKSMRNMFINCPLEDNPPKWYKKQ